MRVDYQRPPIKVALMGLGAVGLATGIGWIVIVMFHGGVFVLERKGIWPKQQ